MQQTNFRKTPQQNKCKADCELTSYFKLLARLQYHPAANLLPREVRRRGTVQNNVQRSLTHARPGCLDYR